jgi:hypothetical protein
MLHMHLLSLASLDTAISNHLPFSLLRSIFVAIVPFDSFDESLACSSDSVTSIVLPLKVLSVDEAMRLSDGDFSADSMSPLRVSPRIESPNTSSRSFRCARPNPNFS